MRGQASRRLTCLILVFALFVMTSWAAQMGTRNGRSEANPPMVLGNGLGDVVINELMLQPLDDDVWIELYNTGNDTISVDDWLISDEDGLEYPLGDLPDMPSGSYIVVHIDHGISDTYFGETQPNALHVYTGWKNVRWTKHVVDSDFHYSRLAFGIDIIPGGKPEIIANRFGGNMAHLYEPQADMTLEWILSPIVGTGALHRTIPADIDDDGHTDLLYNFYFGNEAGGNPSIHWMKAPITTPKDPWAGPFAISQIRRPEGLDAGRINGDNILDVVAGGKFNDEIWWYEAGANPTIDPWTPHSVDLNFNQPGDLELVDLDGDGDLDLIAAGSHGEEVVWYEHPVNPANAWPKHTITAPVGPPSPPTCSEFNAVGELIVWDVDDDQKLDVVVSQGELNKILWYRYDIDPTGVWTEYVIDDNVPGPSGMDIGDIDGDGDLDLIVGATGGMIAWYPQPVQLYNPNWPRYVVDDSVHLTFYVNATDMDGDGDLDLVSADQNDNHILWYENDFLEFAAVDQTALFNSTQRAAGSLVDFVAWGGPAFGEDALAVAAGIWQDDVFVDMAGAFLNETVARDRFSTDSDVIGDWDIHSGKDSFIPTEGTVNYPHPVNGPLILKYNPIVFRGGTDRADGSPPASMPPGLVLANYSTYTFSVNVTNPFGWEDLTHVALLIFSGSPEIAIRWNRVGNVFGEFDIFDQIELLQNHCTAWTDGIYTWHFNFTVIFNWEFISEGPQNVTLLSYNDHFGIAGDDFSNHFTFVKRLRFSDPMLVRDRSSSQVLTDSAWIKPGSSLEVTGTKVIYDVPGEECYPGDDQFNVILTDSYGTNRRDYTSAGYPVSLTMPVPNYGFSTPYDLALALADLHEGVISQGILTHHLNVDADWVQFDQASPTGSVWQLTDSLDCGVRITDLIPGSSVLGSSIEYRIANGSVDRFGEWQSGPLPGTSSEMNPSITQVFPEGANNWIQWRASDAVGNGPSVSPAYRVPVDTQRVAYKDFYPSRVTQLQGTAVWVNITLTDIGGSGVDLDSLQIKVRPSGEIDYTSWYDPDYFILNQSSSASDMAQSGPEMVRVSVMVVGFQVGEYNAIMFRARDVAGNQYTVSEECTVVLTVQTSQPEDQTQEEDLTEYWWIALLLIIIAVIALITVFNRKREPPEEVEEVSEQDSIAEDRS